MEFLQSVFWLLVLLGVMIIVHELGHYWAAVYFGVRVESFSVGFGPRLFGFKIGETDFRFSAILFGGYVKMLGQDDMRVDDGSTAADPGSFTSKPRWQRLIIAVAGPAMNLILAVALLAGLFMFRYPKVLNADGPAIVGNVDKDSPAAKAGVREGDLIVEFDGKVNPTWEDILIKELTGANRNIATRLQRSGTDGGVETLKVVVVPRTDERTQIGVIGWSEQSEIRIKSIRKGFDALRAGLLPGDVIVSVNGIPVRRTAKLIEIISASNGAAVEVIYARNGQRNKASVQPKKDDRENRYMIGIEMEPRVVITKLPFVEAVSESFRFNWRSATLILDYLKGVVQMRLSPKQFEGPVGIARMASQAAKSGPEDFMTLMSMVSLNLAIFNLLPIPVLDGGMILVLLIEMLRRRDLSLQLKERVLQVGLAFLLMMVVFVLYNDISKVILKG